MKILEEWLCYIWKLQRFDKKDLMTCQGEQLTILSPGICNEHSGPDFLNACIIIGDITWHGHIELHVESSAWKTHKHNLDPAYENVILHVVWDNDSPVHLADNTLLPTVSLKNRVDIKLLEKCEQLIQQQTSILCGNQIQQVPTIVKSSMLDRALFERLSNKNTLVYYILDNNKGDWEETSYKLLAHNFGFKINSNAMLELSSFVPLKIIKKHNAYIVHIESLLLGQAGLLPNNVSKIHDAYTVLLIKEYDYLAYKYQLNKGVMNSTAWKFFRLRPANFPTIRIAQLAQILHKQANLFNWLLQTPIQKLKNQLSIVQSDYWQYHYTFAKPSKSKILGLGKSSIENICINTVVPLLVAYGKTHDQPDYIHKAIDLLQSLNAEHNNIIRKWQKYGITPTTAFDSQALIELFNNYCKQKKCLSCNIGTALLQD